ncbi:WD40-repeat-containing domain protein [Mucidula mucida]|nr:WD40-repeat-containing domain protein [Mucidula mucida]
MHHPSSHLLFRSLQDQLPSISHSEKVRTGILSKAYSRPLDRIQVLGNDETLGHTGCVNAVSWAQDGEILISGGDDRTVRIWRGDPTLETSSAYPALSCRAVINTGHRANIFNAQMLPYSSRIATVAGDRQVRVFDVGYAHGGSETEYSNARTHLLTCHEDRVKRIVTEESPDVFLTVSEDGTVRQHDLRSSHTCRSQCPAPLVQMDHELTSLSMSSLTPYQFVVAGQSPYGYLFDRRNLRAKQQSGSSKSITTCTRLFGRPDPSSEEPSSDSPRFRKRDHVTGVRMNSTSSDELIIRVAYSADGVYRFSTLGETSEDVNASSNSVLPSEPEIDDEPPPYPESLSVVLPLHRYLGARNVETVKDVNFLGPRSEYVTIGSDDGNFFMWEKDSGRLHGIYEGDSSIVNVIEGHPHLPLVATSGIDTTVKLFAPQLDSEDMPSRFSRTDNAVNIMESNSQPGTRVPMFRRLDVIQLLLEAQALQGHGGDEDSHVAEIPCTNQ